MIVACPTFHLFLSNRPTQSHIQSGIYNWRSVACQTWIDLDQTAGPAWCWDQGTRLDQGNDESARGRKRGRSLWRIFRIMGNKAHRGRDCCDHCLLFKQSIIPGIRKMPSVAGSPLVAICPSYSDAFDEQAPSIEDDPVSNLQKFFHYSKTHDVERQEDRSSLSRDLAWNWHGLRRTGFGLGGQLNIS